MSICVNLNSNEFKDCCKRLNVSAASLEPIIHEYINTEGNENSFPSDFYISEKLEGTQTIVTSKEQLQLWKDKYSDTKEFSSIEEAIEYYNEVVQFFDKEAIGFKETPDGKYIIRVVEPLYNDITEYEKQLAEQEEVNKYGKDYLLENSIYSNKNTKDINTETSLLNELLKNSKFDYFRVMKGRLIIKDNYSSWGVNSYNGKKSRRNKIVDEEVLIYIDNVLKGFGLSIDDVYFDEVEMGTKYAIGVKIDTSSLHDKIISQSEINEMYGSDEVYEQHRTVLQFLAEKTGLSYEFISENRAVELLGRDLTPEDNAFVSSNKVYYIRGRHFNTDIASEEMLHPFVQSIKNNNEKAFNSLLRDAKKAFPKLHTQIKEAYKSRSKGEQEEELVTQALSRAFRKDYEENTNHNSIKDLIRKFIEFINGWFKDNKDLPWFDKEGNLIDKIYAEDLSETITLENLAKIINSEIKLGKANFVNGIRNNISVTKASISKEDETFISETFVPSEKAKEYGLTESKLTSAIRELSEIESSYEELQDKEITIPYSKYKEAVGEESSAMVRAIVELLKEKNPTIYNKNTKEITIKSEYYFKLASHINKHKEFWEFVFGEDNNGELNLDLDYSFSEYYELGSLESILNALQESGDILYRYKDSRQGELFNEEGLTQKEIDAIKQREEEKQRELDLILQDTLQLNEQIKELSKSDLITMSEVKQLSFDIAYAISDLITQWQDNPEKFFENFPSKRTDNSVLDIAKIQSMSRAELVQFIGVKNLLDTVKELIFGTFPEGVNEDKVILLYDNFDALIRFGADAFGSVEDFQLRYSEVGFVVEDIKTDDETDALSNEEQAVTEELGDKQEHWQIDTRTIDNFLSMSQIVKRELVRCYQLDSNNNPKTNEFGINQRVNPREATSCILRWTQGSLTLADMITKLENKSIANPWIKPIISKLKDSSGKYTDFQSQFFGVFCKHFQEYYIVKEFKEGDKKVYRIMPINVNPALREVMSSIDVLYKMQKHPMFNSNGIIESQFRQLEKAVNKLKELQKQGFNSLDLDQISKGIAYCSELLGYYITPEDVKLSLTEESFNGMIEDLSYIVFNLSKNLGKQDYDPFTFSKKSNGIRGNLSSFLKPLTDILEDTALSSFFDSGKMYQSYIIPSYLTKLMKKLQHADDAEFKRFMQEEYGKYEWFRDQSMSIDEPSSWKNHWLRQLYTMSAEDRKKNFGHKVQLSFLGHNYMRNMSGPEYVLSILTEYFSKEGDSKEASTTAWYKVPMMSNKPSLEFIKFTRHRGIGYETTLLDGFEAIFSQELARIITVKLREYNKKDDRHIGGFDTNGDRFHFLNFLNKYLKEDSGTELGILLNRAIEGEQLSEEDSTKLSDLVRQEIASYMNERVNTIIEGYKSSGIFEAAKKIDGIGNTDEEIESALREFIWNDTFAAMNILQMTITDIAYYKNAEDLQKRLAQIHAPGIRPNVAATDYQGNPVSDGKLRTVFLADYTGEDVVQNIIENLEVVFDRKISQAKTDAERDYWERTKESIIKTFREDINVADAQAYNCPTSYRKKALMFGKWNKKFEETYQKLRKGEYNASDLEIAFQPLKPFVYTNTEKQVGVEGAPLQTIKVGMQFKNAEYALIMADALLQGEDTGKPNLLRALFEVMEASADKNPTKGIDTFMFASAVKAGLHGRINLSKFVEKGDAKGYIEDLIYGDGTDGYNETYVHTFPAEDYSIQQEYSRHFLDHSQAHGSQERYIIPSDLEYVDADGNTVLYEFEDKGKYRKLTADEFRKEYEDTIAENIENSIEALSEELGLNNLDIKTRNIALSKILQKEILSSPRYGMDLYFACSVDKDGNFNIPLGDPIQSKRIEQLINSIVKNRINKQKIAGGPVVQVSNFGMSRRLNIKFKDKQGNILPTLTEWLEKNEGKTVEDYKEYLKENQAGIAYYECYAPAYMQEMFEDFMDENGNIDVEALQELNPELLDMIGYRIPTEDKYSIAPLKIVGFLPKEAGEALVLPYEITVIWGSDKSLFLPD